MKRILKVLMLLLIIFIPFLGVDAKTAKKKTTTQASGERVKLYVFYDSSCTNCKNLHEYISELEGDKSINYMFEVVDYEVSSDQENVNLWFDVKNYFDYTGTSVPFYVIGENYYVGFDKSNSSTSDTTGSPDKLKEKIKTEYKNKKYKDAVAGIAKGSIAIADKDLREDSKANDKVGYIIFGITAIIIIAIIFGRSNTTYYEDEVEEDKTKTNKTTTKKK